MTLYTLVSFFGLAFIMALSPGPNLFYLITRSICQGKIAGFCSLYGIAFGMFLYMLATSVGLSALFTTVPLAYDIVRIAGAGYLLWLAFKIFTSKNTSFGAKSLTSKSRLTLFRIGLVTCLLNPKIALTYGALLPQFVQPESGHVKTQLIVLGVVQIIAAIFAHSIVILFASTLAVRLKRYTTWVSFQRYLLGTALVAIAANLAIDRRAS